MFYLYVLRGEDGRHYVGYTSDLKKRFEQHQGGLNSSTRYQRWRLVYYEDYEREDLARERERKLKAHGRSYQLLIARLSE